MEFGALAPDGGMIAPPQNSLVEAGMLPQPGALVEAEPAPGNMDEYHQYEQQGTSFADAEYTETVMAECGCVHW